MSERFSSSGEIFSWLSGFINLEKGLLPISRSYRPDRIGVLAALAGNPEHCAPVIHIAGSKGKGSVTAMAASILEAGGFRAARNMSPHVSDFRERVSLGNSFFDEEVYCTAGDEMRRVIEEKLPLANTPLFDKDHSSGYPPTFFELITLFYFLCAKAGNCNAMAVETGLGGRLDCTNIVDPLVSVITLIELEHTAVLGNTICQIAGEKAGIIKPGKPVVLSRQCDEALKVFHKTASDKNSALLYFPEIANIDNMKLHQGGTDFSLSFCKNSIPGMRPMEISIPIPGKVQAENAGLAVAAVKTAFPDIAEDAIRKGLENVKIPARFEKIADNPPFILDGAHTPQSVSMCCETFCSLYGNGGILLFGCGADKNIAEMAKQLLPRFSQIVITTPGNFKISNTDEIFRIFSIGGDGYETGKTSLVKNTADALGQVLTMSRKNGLPVLCTGSFYLAAEVRALF
jgi:dihydrofolate synthase/folylpolyglutamate synthase